MAWTDAVAPNIADFNDFIANSMQVPAGALASNSPYPQFSLNRALNIVFNLPVVAQLEYTQAVYNCGGHILVRSTPDISGSTFFADTRKSFDMNEFQSGVISSASDQGTSDSFAVPESLMKLTVGDLDFLKTPWGREYIAYAQDFGEIAGLS